MNIMTLLRHIYPEGLKQAVEDHEADIREQQRLDRLDYTGMTLPDLKREHHAVTIRLHREYNDPEGLTGLREREDLLMKEIKRKERR